MLCATNLILIFPCFFYLLFFITDRANMEQLSQQQPPIAFHNPPIFWGGPGHRLPPIPGAYAGFGNPTVMPGVLHNAFHFPRPHAGMGPITPPHGSRKIKDTTVQPQSMLDDMEKGKQCRWLDTEVEVLIEWLEIPGMYEQWRSAGVKAIGGSTNPSGLSKAKMCNSIIHKYLSENGVQKTPAQIQNKIGYMEVMYRKACDYCKSTGEGVTERDIVMGYPHIMAKLDSICPYFWRLGEFMKDRPCTNPPYISDSMDTHEGGVESIFGSKRPIDLDDVTHLSSDEEDVQVVEESDVPDSDPLGTHPLESHPISEDPCSPAPETSMERNPSQPNSSTSRMGKRKEETVGADSVHRNKKKTRAATIGTESALPIHSKKPKIFVDVLKEIGDLKRQHDEKVLIAKEEWQKRNFELLKEKLEIRRQESDRKFEIQQQELILRQKEADNRNLMLQLELAKLQARSNPTP